VVLTASFVAVGIADFYHQEPVYEALMALDLPMEAVENGMTSDGKNEK
jgi:hypothetical protein